MQPREKTQTPTACQVGYDFRSQKWPLPTHHGQGLHLTRVTRVSLLLQTLVITPRLDNIHQPLSVLPHLGAW